MKIFMFIVISSVSEENFLLTVRLLFGLGANILRDISGNVKLGDFGTSRRLIAITNQSQGNSGTIGSERRNFDIL